MKHIFRNATAKIGFLQQKPISTVEKKSLSHDRKTASSTDTITRLSSWDQASMRGYMRVVLCFPFVDSAISAAEEHIKASLVRLARHRPDFAGTLEVHDGGIVHLRTSGNPGTGKATIPFSIEDISSEFPYASYDEVKAAAFPPGAFVGPRFWIPCDMAEGKPGVPVVVVKAFLIPGGFLLGVFFNHAIADGDCLRIFLNAFSGQTCNTVIDGASVKELNVPLSGQNGGSAKVSLNALFEKVPEYTLLEHKTGPTMPRMRKGGVPMDQITKIGKIFVFDNARLEELGRNLAEVTTHPSSNGNSNGNGTSTGNNNSNCNNHRKQSNGNGKQATCNDSCPNDGLVPTRASCYTCLAALTWVHITRARMADGNKYMPRCAGVDDTALLQTMVNWKRRAFQGLNENYFGNSTAVAVTRVATDGILVEAGTDTAKLAELVSAIEHTINSVDDNYVRNRTELFLRVSDPRLVGLRFDPRTPQDLGFNTWRFFGADTTWTIPGVGTGAQSPDMIRRLQDAWNMSGALILPAKSTSKVHELLVTLPKSSMDLLCQDAGWMQWVDRVIG